MLTIELYYLIPGHNMMDETQKGEFVGFVTFVISDFKEGQTSDCWYNLSSPKGNKLACAIHLSMKFKVYYC
jgi:hypothetical protein